MNNNEFGRSLCRQQCSFYIIYIYFFNLVYTGLKVRTQNWMKTLVSKVLENEFYYMLLTNECKVCLYGTTYGPRKRG